jgi:predicted enzyme related to lactoylglutathione lyase
MMKGIEVLGIDNIMIAVGDLDHARAFYEGILGLSAKFSFPELGILGYRLGNEEPGLVLRCQSLEPAPARATPRVWLEVPDARAAAAQLRSAEAVMVGDAYEIHTGWVVEIADPWGNVLGLVDYANAPAMARKQPSGQDAAKIE